MIGPSSRDIGVSAISSTAVAEAPGLAVLILFLALDPVSLLVFSFLLAREICLLVRSHVLPNLLLVRCVVTYRVLPLLLNVFGGRLVCVHHVEATLRWHLLKVVLLAAPRVRGANVEEVGATDIEETKLPTPVLRI